MLAKIRQLVNEAGDREKFFKLIAIYYPPSDERYKLIEKAYNDAKDAFRGKFRDGGERYFEHLRAVALIVIEYLRVNDYEMIIAALLHDIVEDIPSWTIERIRETYGSRVAMLVDYMTKPKRKFKVKTECEHAYHQRFINAPRDFFLLKLADRIHNLLTLWSCAKEKRLRKINETIHHYLPYAEKHFILFHEFKAIIEELQQAI